MTTRFGLLVPHFGEDADQDRLIQGARLAEDLGFDSLWVRDHLVFHPHGMEGTDRTFIEPFVTLAFLAGVLSHLLSDACTVAGISCSLAPTANALHTACEFMWQLKRIQSAAVLKPS